MRIREIFKERNTSAKEVADKLGMSVSGLNQQIIGNPSVGTLERIASALDVPVWHFFVNPEELNQSAEPTDQSERLKNIEQRLAGIEELLRSINLRLEEIDRPRS